MRKHKAHKIQYLVPSYDHSLLQDHGRCIIQFVNKHEDVPHCSISNKESCGISSHSTDKVFPGPMLYQKLVYMLAAEHYSSMYQYNAIVRLT
jgi:hypothetical protein